MAISNHDYDINDLKEDVKEKKIDFKQVLKSIPGEEIKEYLLTPKGMDSVSFEKDIFAAEAAQLNGKAISEFKRKFIIV